MNETDKEEELIYDLLIDNFLFSSSNFLILDISILSKYKGKTIIK